MVADRPIKGQIIGGELGKLCIRQKSGTPLEIGELLICEGQGKIILQVYDLAYGSQISTQNLELISGMNLEEGTEMQFLPNFATTHWPCQNQ